MDAPPHRIARAFRRHRRGARPRAARGAACPPARRAAAPEKKDSARLRRRPADPDRDRRQGEYTAEIVDRILGLSPELLNARIQRAAGG